MSLRTKAPKISSPRRERQARETGLAECVVDEPQRAAVDGLSGDVLHHREHGHHASHVDERQQRGQAPGDDQLRVGWDGR